MNATPSELSPYLIQEQIDAPCDKDYVCPLPINFKLDSWQQQAGKAIHLEHNVLLSCATGAGKTLPCLFAINYYLKKNKRVIYTSPVKSLSNQKYKEFSEKVPDVGIMTGDIKCNPDAQCLIMTTEILRNMLYKQNSTASENATSSGSSSVSEKSSLTPSTSSTHLKMDDGFLSTVGCVIFDEIHYINDKDRGKNWEESIVMLPPEIAILGCSGTIDEPERFASWIGDIKKRPIHLIRTVRRPIPLNHYIYVDNMDGYANYKKVTVAEAKKKAAEFDLKKLAREASSLSIDPVLDMDDEDVPESTSGASEKATPNSQNAQNASQNHEKKGMIHIMKGEIFLARNYDIAHNIYQNKCIDPVTKKPTKMGNPRYSKSQAPGDLNTFLDFLKKGRYLPSLIFVLSRRRVEEYAAAVQITLLDHEERNEVGKLFDINLSKFGKQYKELNQYNQVRDLLMRGIGIHHSGLIPVLKEAVEILFSKGLIKLLFATETFAIGVNMPTKTVVFTEFYKPTGASLDLGSKSSGPMTRILKTDEYLQMSGRAGRRGLDSTGTIIIFPVRELPGNGEMTTMMTGHTPAISSKFSPGYQFILKCMVNNKNLWDILNSSLRSRQDKIMEEHYKKEQKRKTIEYEERIKKLKTIYGENIIELTAEYDSFYQMSIPQTVGNSYVTIKPNKDKNVERKLQELGKKVPKSCYKEYVSIMELKNSLADGVDRTTSETLDTDKDKLQPVFEYLTYLGYLSSENYSEEPSENHSEKSSQNPLEKTKVTTKGIIAAEINDSNCILMTEMIVQGFFDELEGPEMLALLSLFIQESEETDEDQKMSGISRKLNEMIDRVFYMRDDLERLEEEMVLAKKVYLDTDWSIYTDFVPIAYLWASGAHISEIYQISNIYEGNLVKNMLRLQNIAEGIVEVFKSLEKHEQANKLKETSDSIIRDIVTNNSLYVTT